MLPLLQHFVADRHLYMNHLEAEIEHARCSARLVESVVYQLLARYIEMLKNPTEWTDEFFERTRTDIENAKFHLASVQAGLRQLERQRSSPAVAMAA